MKPFIKIITTLFLTIALTAQVLASADKTTAFKNQLTSTAYAALLLKAKNSAETLNSKKYDVSISPPPAGLNLKACSTSPDTRILSEKPVGQQRIGIRCKDKDGWSLYLKGNIRVFIPILVSRHSLVRGTALSDSDVITREMDISSLKRGYIPLTKQITNMELTRKVSAGQPLTPGMVKPAQVIKRGHRVTLTAKNNGFEISMPGEALENGALKEYIKVRNLSSGKIIRGRITGIGIVEVR